MKLKQKPSGIWLVEFEGENGERRRVSTGVKTAPQKTAPPEARVKARDIVLGIAQPIQAAPRKTLQGDGRVTMRDLFGRCEKTVWHPDNAKSQGTIRSNIKALTPLIGDVAIQDVTYSRLEDLVAELKAKGYAPATVKRKMDMVSKALRMATKWSDDKGRPLLPYKPTMPEIRVSNVKDRVVSPLEETALFNAVELRRQAEPGRQWFRLRGLLEFLLDTGARLGEAMMTGPTSITVNGQLMDLGHRYDGTEQAFVTWERYRTKNDKPRTVPLTGKAWRALLALVDHLGRDKEGRWLFFPMTSGTAWYMFDQAREDVKKQTGMDMSDVTIHTLRHTCLTRLAQGGMDVLRLKEWAGHSDIKITAERYTHLKPSDLLGGLAILNPAASLRLLTESLVGAVQ